MIRPAQSCDAAAVRTLVHDAYEHWVPRLGRVPGPMKDDYARRIAANQVWVLEQDGEIIGAVVLEEQPGHLLLENVAVLPWEQGKGFGRMLIAFAEQEAARRGFPELQLCTNVRMVENIALYQYLGFTEIGRISREGVARIYLAKPVPAAAPARAGGAMRVRPTSRLILLDDDRRVLLFRIEDATVFRPDEVSLETYWITPGGSLEAGESHDAAARRELWEETGMTGIELGPWVAICEPVLSWAGELVQAHDRFYLARVSATAVTLENLSAAERAVYREHRWWDVAKLRASGERVVPPGLVALLARIVAGDVPAQPLWLE